VQRDLALAAITPTSAPSGALVNFPSSWLILGLVGETRSREIARAEANFCRRELEIRDDWDHSWKEVISRETTINYRII